MSIVWGSEKGTASMYIHYTLCMSPGAQWVKLGK